MVWKTKLASESHGSTAQKGQVAAIASSFRDTLDLTPVQMPSWLLAAGGIPPRLHFSRESPLVQGVASTNILAVEPAVPQRMTGDGLGPPSRLWIARIGRSGIAGTLESIRRGSLAR